MRRGKAAAKGAWTHLLPGGTRRYLEFFSSAVALFQSNRCALLRPRPGSCLPPATPGGYLPLRTWVTAAVGSRESTPIAGRERTSRRRIVTRPRATDVSGLSKMSANRPRI